MNHAAVRGCTESIDHMDAAEIARAFDGRASSYDDSAMHHWQARQVAMFAGPTLGDLLDVGTRTGLALRAAATAARTLTATSDC